MWGPSTSHLGTTSYLAFWISPAEEKDVARLRLEGSSLEKKESQKSGPQTPAISYLMASIREAACWALRQLREVRYMHPKNLTQHSHLNFFPGLPPYVTGECQHAHPDARGFPTP